MRGIPSSKYWAAGLLLFEVVPTKALKPVANLLGDVAKYSFKYANDLLDLVKVIGIFKLAEIEYYNSAKYS